MDEFENNQEPSGLEVPEVPTDERPKPYEPEPVPEEESVLPPPVVEDGVAGEPPIPPGSKLDEPQIDELAAKDESRVSTLARQSLRWILGFFIVFGIGFLVALFALYQPTVHEVNTYQAELQAADEKIDSLQSEIGNLEGQIRELEGVEAQVVDLQSQLGENVLEMRILRTRLAVSEASQAILLDDAGRVTLYMNTATDTLALIKPELDADQMKIFDALEQRMQLAIDEYQESPDSAQADLEIIGTRLLELQDALFGGP